MAISWVAGTDPVRVTATTVAASTPAGLANDDALFAFVTVKESTSCTPPAGWSLLDSVTATHPARSVKLFVFQKDTVTSGNSSTSYTFTAGTSAVLELFYAAVRSGSTTFATIGIATDFADNVNSGGSNLQVVPASVTAASNGAMVVGAGAYGYSDESTYGPAQYEAPPSGMTGWTATFTYSTYSIGAYQARDSGQAVSTGYYRWDITTSAPVGAWATISLLVADAVTGPTSYEDTVADTVDVDAHTAAPTRETISDTISIPHVDTVAGLVPFQYVLYAVKADLAFGFGETVTGSDTVTPHPRWGYHQQDTIIADSQDTPNLTYGDTLEDDLEVSLLLSVAFRALLADGVTAAAALQVLHGAHVVEALALAGAVTPTATYALTLAQDLTVSEAVTRFFGASLAETVTTTETMAGVYVGHVSTAETVTLAETLGHTLILKVIVPEALEITPAEAVKMLYQPTLVEGIEVSAAYVQPSGTVTTWAVNTRTAATTEYTGYDFNSFAKMGRKYLAASSTGLYVLEGSTDAGEDIIADLKTGFAQFAGSRFAGLKAVYLGVHGEGEFVLRVIEGDGTERDYQAIVANRRTAKVQVGKGLRARYFAFELISTGQVFDLDTIEMVPLLMQRRV